MDAKKLIQVLRDDLNKASEKNIAQFSMKDLQIWIDDLDKFVENSPPDGPTEVQMEEWRMKREGQVLQYKAEQESNLEGFRSTIQFGQAALKSSILINGGAAVAILAFIGHILGSGVSKTIQSEISYSLLIFFVGVLAAAMACGTSYFSQSYYFELRNNKVALIWRIASVVLVIFSYICFLWGGLSAYWGFTTAITG